MIDLTLADVEREILDLAEEADDAWDSAIADKLRALARRIAVQLTA